MDIDPNHGESICEMKKTMDEVRGCRKSLKLLQQESRRLYGVRNQLRADVDLSRSASPRSTSQLACQLHETIGATKLAQKLRLSQQQPRGYNSGVQ